MHRRALAGSVPGASHPLMPAGCLHLNLSMSALLPAAFWEIPESFILVLPVMCGLVLAASSVHVAEREKWFRKSQRRDKLADN